MMNFFLSLALLVGSWAPIICFPAPAPLGAYHWLPDETEWDGQPNRIERGTKLITDVMGMGIVRVSLGYDENNWPGSDPTDGQDEDDYLVRCVDKPEYDEFLKTMNGKTVLFTIYTKQAFQRKWANGTANLLKQKNSFYKLALWLGEFYPEVTFGICSWEGNWDEYYGNPTRDPNISDAFKAFLTMQVQGVRQAAAPNVFTVLEINCPRGGLASPCDTTGVTERIAQVGADKLFYSSWMTTVNYTNVLSYPNLQHGIESDLDSISSITGYYGKNLWIGEIGRPADALMDADSWWKAVDFAGRTRELGGIVVWQAINNDPSFPQYGMFDKYLRMTDNGAALQRLVASHNVTFWRKKKF